MLFVIKPSDLEKDESLAMKILFRFRCQLRVTPGAETATQVSVVIGGKNVCPEVWCVVSGFGDEVTLTVENVLPEAKLLRTLHKEDRN